MADRVVLAAIGPAANQFRIVAIIKGKDAVGDSITDPVTGADAAAAVTPDPFLLISRSGRFAMDQLGDHSG